jgi:hypothetical protein
MKRVRILCFVFLITGLFVSNCHSGINLGITGAIKEDMKKLDDKIAEKELEAERDSVSSAPNALQTKLGAGNQIHLSWSYASQGQGLNIERKIDGGDYVIISTSSISSTSYIDSGVAANTKYWYRIRAYNGDSYSTYSIESWAKTFAGIYNSPGSNPSGITWDGTYIWTCDSSTGKIYKHNIDTNLTVIATYNSPNLSPSRSPSGLAWDGASLWSCDDNISIIYKHNMDSTLSLAKSYGISDVYGGTKPKALMWDGANLWSTNSNYGDYKIYKHNMDATLTIANTYTPPNNNSVGLAWDGIYIYSIDALNPVIYKHNRDSSLSISDTTVFYTDIGLRGLVWDGHNFWFCGAGKIYKY